MARRMERSMEACMYRNVFTGWFSGRTCSVVGSGLLLTVLGCETLPRPTVSQQAVLEAAKQVIAERYPTSSAVSQEGPQVYVVAVSPVRTEAAWKTRKQISVIVQQNYTGNYTPVVVVRLDEEVGDLYAKSNPESPTFVHAAPLQDNKWRPLDRLLYEEQEIYDAILAKLQPKGI